MDLIDSCLEGLVDVTSDAVWLCSSCKSGHEISNLLDPMPDSYWQSDGPLPHTITVSFSDIKHLKYFYLYTDAAADDSYTPMELSIRMNLTGSSNDFMEILLVEMEQAPKGWIRLPLDGEGILASSVQLMVISNYQEGKDTRLRSIRIYAKPLS